MPTAREMADLAASLKSKIQQNKTRLRREGLPSDLSEELLDAIHSIESAISDSGESISDSLGTDVQELHGVIADSVRAAIDSAMQPCQSALADSTVQLSQYLPRIQEAIKAFTLMEEEYEERLARTENQRQQLADQIDKTQALHWRLARQRKALAQTIRAQRAEMQLDLVKAKADLDARLNEALEAEWAKTDVEMNEMRQELQTAEQEVAHWKSSSQKATLELEKQLGQQNQQLQAAREEIESLRNQLVQAQETASRPNEQDQVLREQLAAVQKELNDTQEQLFRTANQIGEKDTQIGEKDKLISEKDTLINEHERRLRQVSQQLIDNNQQLVEARDELEHALAQVKQMQSSIETSSHQGDSAKNDSYQLRLELEETQEELSDLRDQNSVLAAKIAQLTADTLRSSKGVGSANPEILTWEDRKKLMLQQLETDGQEGADSAPAINNQDRLNIEEIIATTQSEIERRDREIEELREIVQMQSEARQGVAIGAAGVAQMLDDNDLINQERKKLQEIQQEWEAKLRQAEIDLSMERAKLARERSELELQLTHLQREVAQGQSIGQTPGDKQQRRWMNFLGIKEETNE